MSEVFIFIGGFFVGFVVYFVLWGLLNDRC